MKKFIKFLMTVGLTVLAVGCKKDLSLVNKSAYSEDTYFTSDAAINQAVVATYAGLLHTGMWTREWYYTFDLLGYDAKANQPLVGDLLQLAQYNFGTDQNQAIEMWDALYQIIARANVVIDRAQAWKPANATETTDQTQYVAEAKFYVLMPIFNWLIVMGGCLCVPNISQRQHPRKLTWEITCCRYMAFIEQDLKDAETGLPASYATANYGRATLGAAVALFGKILPI